MRTRSAAALTRTSLAAVGELMGAVDEHLRIRELAELEHHLGALRQQRQANRDRPP